MEVSSCSSPINLKMISLNSHFTSQFSIKTSKRRNQIRSNNKNAPLTSYLLSSTKRSFTVFSHFSRTTTRRNSLRKKLVGDHRDQVRHVPRDIQHPSPTLADKDANLDENIFSDSVEEVDSMFNVSNPKINGDSVRFEKLKNWVEQYERDSESEAISPGLIFTESERVPAETNSKVSGAEGLSSGTRRSNLWEAIQGSGLSPKVAKELPRAAGIMLMYGFVAVWALRKLFHFGDRDVELTELEKEMVRRKIKSRNEREALEEKVYVEVVREPPEPVFLGEKPKLDKQELVKDIGRVKTAATAESSELDGKILEIREMAREARRIESAKNGSVENRGSGDEVEDEKEEAAKLLAHLVDGDREQRSNDGDSGAGFILHETCGGNGNVALQEESTILIANHGVTHLTDDNNVSPDDLLVSRESSVRVKPRIIRSVIQARAYLSEKNHAPEGKEESRFEAVLESDLNQPPDEQYNDDDDDDADKQRELTSVSNGKPKASQGIASDHESDDENTETELSVETGAWNESNIDEQIAKKIGIGFKDNFMTARENKNPAGNTNSSFEELRSMVDRNELDWMEDDHLAEIVFQVRENELAGYDPFHKMDAKDKKAFFEGLEKKVERENEKLSVLHNWLHSNIENIDYGVDGISVYDPPEKIIPRWKGPILEKSPEFMNNFHEQRKAIFAEYTGISNYANEDTNQLKKSGESKLEDDIATSSALNDPNKKLHKSQKNSKTVIESSDGTLKPGKKSGKEFWQHTKKWSRGFLESYNAETDPDIKSAMADMGKGLDRWITEEEIQEASELMDKLPVKAKEFMDKKLGKIKREMELFGPQAVVSKYREYTDDDKEDYLWWLDLPHILCIELYIVEEDEQRIGFYSLEMATDLELEPKPHHVIAFEDAGDCKNLCYIIQAKMETLRNGHAFVVAQPPKDAFREARENGFNVSVIRKGELQLNVDQTLEEVEEQICEIGSKMYHDTIMRDHSVDISSVMKGVFGFQSRPSKPMRRKLSKKMLKKRGNK